MALKTVTHLNGHFSRFLAGAFVGLNRWRQHDRLLFCAYVLFLGLVPIFEAFAYYLFLCAIVPLVALKAVRLDAYHSPAEGCPPPRLCLPGVRNGISVILCAAGVYLLVVTISSVMEPTIGLKKLPPLLVISLETIAFVVVTALLVVNGYLYLCLGVVAVFTGATALTLIIRCLATVPFDQLFFSYRLGYYELQPGQTSLAIISGIFLVASIASLREGSRSPWYRIPLIASGLTLICTLLLTQSRGVLLAAGAGIAALFVRSSRSIRVTVGVIALIAAVIFMTVPELHEMILRRGDSRRLEIWNHYIAFSSKRPWLGYGMIDGLAEGMAFTSKDGTYVPHAHNLILSAQVRGGVLATVAMIMMLFGGLYYSARYAKLKGERAPLAIMVTLVVSGIFEYDTFIRNFPSWQIVSFWFPVGICAGAELCVKDRARLATSAIPHPSSA
jgi:O-antigen ligase